MQFSEVEDETRGSSMISHPMCLYTRSSTVTMSACTTVLLVLLWTLHLLA